MPESLSNDELKWGYWYFLHRQALRRVAVGLLAVVSFGLIAYSGWQLTDWLSGRKAEDEELRLLVSSSVNFADYHKRNAPLPLVVGTVTAVPNGVGTYDLIAQVKNPNLKWGVTSLPFVFVLDTVSVTANSYIMPLEEKYLVSVGVKLPRAPAQVRLEFAEIGWRRVDDARALPTASFTVKDERQEQVEGVGTQLRFTLTNTSPYSFWQVGVVVVLTNHGVPVAVGRQFIADVASGQDRPMEFIWSHLTASADQLVVKPEVNVFDSASLKPL